MTDLKTLKDLEFVDEAVRNKTSYLVNSTDLRQEAIKWVKESDKIAENPESSQDSLRDFWLERFNLTEEDLK